MNNLNKFILTKHAAIDSGDSLLSEANHYFNNNNINISQDSIFKFLSSANDINSLLQTRLIWANNKTDGLQFDEYCDALTKETGKQWGFISLTAEPTKVALELRRPFGIEFDLKPLLSYVEENDFKYNSFNQLDYLNKIPTKDTTANALRINAIGKRRDGTYFLALQGNYEPRNIDETTYNSLLKWLKQNSSNQLVHFDFNKVPAAEVCKKVDNHYLHTVGDYIDYENSTVTTEIITTENGNKYINLSNKCFIPTLYDGVGFTVLVRDYIELWATCLNKSIGLNTQSTKNYLSHIYNIWVKPLVTDITKKDYAIDSDTFNKLADVLNEYEFRIYLPSNVIFRFNWAWIKSIRLPKKYEIRKGGARETRVVQLEKIFTAFNTEHAASDETMINICNEYLVQDELENQEIVDLYKLIRSHNLQYIFYDYSTKEISKNVSYTQANFEPKQPGEPNKPNNDKTRYMVDKSVLDKVFNSKVGDKNDAENPEYRVIKLIDKEGNPSLIYKDFNPTGLEPMCARLEVRGIILGQSDDGDWYINVIRKSNNFSELPGGSFNTLPPSEAGLFPIAANKFNAETGLKLSANDLTLLDNLTYMYEEKNNYISKLVRGTNLAYPYTVDWTFITVLEDPVDITKQQLNADGESKWLLIDYAFKDHEFMRRYRNLKNIILNTIEANTKADLNNNNNKIFNDSQTSNVNLENALFQDFPEVED